MPFVKGQSGNPTGRAPMTRDQRQFIRWCQLAIKQKGWKLINKFLASNIADHQKWAMEILLDRGFGKPMQVNQNENYDMTPEQALSDEQLRAKAREILQKEADANDRPTPGIGSDSQNSGIPAVQ